MRVSPLPALSLAVLLAPLARAQSFTPCTSVVRTLTGESAGDQFGWVSAPVADVTGDGIQELLVSAPGNDGGGNGAGRVYLYDGATWAELFRVSGAAAGEGLGWAVRDAGDVSGDGVTDVIVGGTGRDVARVLSGVDGSQVHALRLGPAGSQFGYSVEGMGDVDGDLVPDLAVGAIADGTSFSGAGRVWIVSGVDGATVIRQWGGFAAGEQLGSSVARLGDVTGDGVPELAAGAANAGPSQRGRVYVLDPVSGAVVHTLEASVGGSQFGRFFAASTGDVDADGFPDLYVGDYAHASGRGKAYVFSGLTGLELWSVTGGVGAGFGIGRPVGDLDGDGASELVLAAYTFSGGAPGAGRASILSGADGAVLRQVTSRTTGEGFGFDAHGIGDVDGDGTPDTVVTAATFNANRGRVYVLARAPVESLGGGLPGSGQRTPVLTLQQCPRPGEATVFAVDDGLGGAQGVLYLGTRRRDRNFRGGVFSPDAVFVRFSHRLGGTPGVAGEGSVALLQAVPDDPALVGMDFYSQALYLDPGSPVRFSMTPALRIDVY